MKSFDGYHLLEEMRFKDFWMTNKKKFFKINPSRHCDNHCAVNSKNKMILDYLSVDKEHLGFV